MIKSGLDHIASLRDGRAVYLHGKRVDDVTRHPAYANAVKSIGRLFDFPSRHQELMTFVADSRRARQSHLAASRKLPGAVRSPQSARGLERPARRLHGPRARPRRVVHFRHVHGAGCVRSLRWRAAKALADYYRYARDNDLYLTYVIINPQADRSKSASGQQDEFLTAGVVDRDAAGVTVRGAKMLGDRRHHGQRGLRHLHPAASAGRRAVCHVVRHPDEHQGPENPVAQVLRGGGAQVFDNPLVEPLRRKRRRPVLRRRARCRGSGSSDRQPRDVPEAVPRDAGHVYQNYQAMVRLSVKFRFLPGLRTASPR